MTQALKSFILGESVKTNHAERYLSYLERYHHQVFIDLKKQLSDDWAKVVKKLARSHVVDDQTAQEISVVNPKATLEITLVTTPEKLLSARERDPIETAPSVKIPLALSQGERELCVKQLLDSARDSLEETASRWSEIFKYEKNGKLLPWFKILKDRDEVRLQLALKEGDSESYKTLYAVRVELGKKGTKLKDFDRVYCCSLTGPNPH